MESDKAIVIMIMLGSSQELRASRFPRGHRRRGDSDSEDDDFTSDHTSGPDYDSAGDEVNDRILQALERLHQDMKSVLRRLSSMEEAVMSQQVGSRLLYVFSDTVFENPQCEHCLYQNLVITITYFHPKTIIFSSGNLIDMTLFPWSLSFCIYKVLL